MSRLKPSHQDVMLLSLNSYTERLLNKSQLYFVWRSLILSAEISVWASIFFILSMWVAVSYKWGVKKFSTNRDFQIPYLSWSSKPRKVVWQDVWFHMKSHLWASTFFQTLISLYTLHCRKLAINWSDSLDVLFITAALTVAPADQFILTCTF